jgi:hypothetical protein
VHFDGEVLDWCDEGAFQSESTNFVDDFQSLHSQPTSETDLVVSLSCDAMPAVNQAATLVLTHSIALEFSCRAS